MLDERGETGYPDGVQAADGTIYIVHTASWNKLSFVPGKNFGRRGTAGLPGSGSITAVGIFDAEETSVNQSIALCGDFNGLNSAFNC